MSYATLLHGEPRDVVEELDFGGVDQAGLSMALTNAFRRIAALEHALQKLRAGAGEPAAGAGLSGE